MASDFYVDLLNGNDKTGDGKSPATAYRHVSRIMPDLGVPINESITIKLVYYDNSQNGKSKGRKTNG